jgi:hypothetical protein
MISPYKLSATGVIADFQFPTANFRDRNAVFQIGNRQLPIGNSSGR